MSLSRRTFVAAIPVGALALPSIARARVAGELAYPWAQVWQTAVRLLRVDLEYPITDRDESVGYVLFEHRERDRSHPGSLELVRVTARDGSERVRVAVRVPAMPSWVERTILDRLERKLREDYGDPRTPPRPAVPEAPSDDTDDQENDDGEATQ